jgi:hypothetical protein
MPENALQQLLFQLLTQKASEKAWLFDAGTLILYM